MVFQYLMAIHQSGYVTGECLVLELVAEVVCDSKTKKREVMGLFSYLQQ